MIKTEDIKQDLFKLEQMVLDKKEDELFTHLDNAELTSLHEAIQKAYEIISNVVAEEIDSYDLADILNEAGAGCLDEYIMEIDEDSELTTLYYN